MKANLKTALFWGGSFSGNDALWTPVDGSSGGYLFFLLFFVFSLTFFYILTLAATSVSYSLSCFHFFDFYFFYLISVLYNSKATLFYNTSLILNSNFGAGTAVSNTRRGEAESKKVAGEEKRRE